jgi:hypothetical protein
MPMGMAKDRLPRNRRAKAAPAFRLTERDVQLMTAVLEFRFLYVEQFKWLFPESSKQGLATRLRLLYHAGYLARRVTRVLRENVLVYALTEKGAELLAEQQGVTREEIPWNRKRNKITPGFMNHLLDINSVVIGFRQALRLGVVDGSVKDFKVWPCDSARNRMVATLRDEHGRRYDASVVPDAMLAVIFKGGEYALFAIELDRATMTRQRWAEKIEVYREFQRSPALKDQYKASWMIVLTVTTSPARIASLAEATVRAGGKRGYWFALQRDFTPEAALGYIWTRASDMFEMRRDELGKVASYQSVARCRLVESVDRV